MWRSWEYFEVKRDKLGSSCTAAKTFFLFYFYHYYFCMIAIIEVKIMSFLGMCIVVPSRTRVSINLRNERVFCHFHSWAEVHTQILNDPRENFQLNSRYLREWRKYLEENISGRHVKLQSFLFITIESFFSTKFFAKFVEFFFVTFDGGII